MAIFKPERRFLQAQIRSIADQDFGDIETVFVISDTVSSDLVRDLAEEARLRFRLVQPGQTLDSVRGFEAGLNEALATARPDALFALCDQDDIWHPDRLSAGVAKLRDSGADLVHSDARLIDATGRVVHTSMFRFERRDRKSSLRGLLYRNSITGMTVLMTRRVVEASLPFPPQNGVHYYHDLWLGLIAAAMDGIALIDRPLVDYRQHGRNAIGAIDRQRSRLFALPDTNWLRISAGAYGLSRYLAKCLVIRMHEVISSNIVQVPVQRLDPVKPYLNTVRGAGSHLADGLRLLVTGQTGQAAIAGSFAAVSAGRFVWSLRRALRFGLAEAVEHFDHRLYALSPGVSPSALPGVAANASAPQTTPYKAYVDGRKSAKWVPKFEGTEPAVNILVPTLNPTEIFAGIVTALDIGLGLAQAGHRVRFIAMDLPIAAHHTSRAFVLHRLGATTPKEVGDRIDLQCGVTQRKIGLHRADRFLATAWWTAHAADALIRDHGFTHRRFHYLIQDFEPNFYAWGSEFADAMSSYDFDFDPIFNTTLLRDYFRTEGFAFARPESYAFHPAIDIPRYAGIVRRKSPKQRRLALYGRPEVPRNMFPLAIEALAKFIEKARIKPSQLELVSIGLKHGPIALPNGMTLTSLGKLPWGDYPDYLAGVDIGLSLMLSPHPSHPPIEMAAAGARVVTNSFTPKDLSVLTPSILSSEANADALADALAKVWAQRDMPTASARTIDLTRIGAPLEQVVAALSDDLTQTAHSMQAVLDDA